ncbi:pilus assembly protein PilM [Ornithinibacillus sp. L9]|uniref:Pilus assembly protein PilM n=1 Tax=Ornithinibacillus caprae TaxID=2678566 RepID=A0A6N8FFP4_9BACI|nr:pilus assembly protein PilM [Ornithinibacillus caprae]MUK86857.1 pilus assembly protein PilM [Ornithinibacillus caprae]
MGLMNNGRVNIVITNQALRYSYHKNPSVVSMITHGEVELPEGTIVDGMVQNKTVFEEVVHKLVKENKWKRKKLYFSVPDDTVVIRQIQIPVSLTNAEAIGYIRTQIGSSIYLPFSNPSLAVDFIDASETTRNVLLYAYPKEKISAYEEVFEKSGLRPIVADLTALSVFRFYYQHKHEENDHVLLIHWNRDGLILTAFQHDKAVFTRHMKINGREPQGNIAEESAEQTINEYMIEVNRIIDFYQYSITKGQSSIELILLSGDYPSLPSVRKNLTENISIPVFQFPLEKLSIKYLDVLGLALKNEG